MLTRILKISALLIVWFFAAGGVVAAQSQKSELLLVYWGSDDCRWCTYWESSSSGMEQRLKESDEFKKITYRVVKNMRLADSYEREHFSKDIEWLYERVKQGEDKRTGRPGWVLYVNKKRVASFYGSKNWDEKHFPKIKQLIATYSEN